MQTEEAEKGTFGIGGWRKGCPDPLIQLSLRDLEASLQDPKSGEHVCSELLDAGTPIRKRRQVLEGRGSGVHVSRSFERTCLRQATCTPQDQWVLKTVSCPPFLPAMRQSQLSHWKL